MTEKGLKYVDDIIHAIELIEDFIRTTSSFPDYVNDMKTRSAVERQFRVYLSAS
jgi:uncharacterized protein with HEPN domain